MKIRPLIFHLPRSLGSRRHGFTLIELLVVISIIAVLAGLLFPAMGAVRTSARKTSAANDCMQIVNAVKNFYTDYGKYPVTSGDEDYQTPNTSNALVINELIAKTNTHNTRKVRYLEIKEPKTGTVDADVRGAVDSTGNWKDPWYHAYVILIDADYNGEIAVTGVHTEYNGTRQMAAGALSWGPTKRATDGPETNVKPIVSWN